METYNNQSYKNLIDEKQKRAAENTEKLRKLEQVERVLLDRLDSKKSSSNLENPLFVTLSQRTNSDLWL